MELASTTSLGEVTAAKLENFQIRQNSVANNNSIRYDTLPYGKVLIVDDVTSNLFVASKLLEPYGMQVSAAASGEDALALIQYGEVFDVIFMDHMMPGMDGVETTKAIKETGYTNPIVALSANVLLGQGDRYKEHGFVAFISKPIDVQKLDDIITKYVKGKSGETNMANENFGKSLTGLLRECVNRDASKAFGALTELMAQQVWGDEQYNAYTLSTHGIKSALASISYVELSSVAATLEMAGKSRDKLLIMSKTPDLIAGLKDLMEATAVVEEKEIAGTGTEDMLVKQLTIVNDACSRFNKKDARGALGELDKYAWQEDVSQLLSQLNACLPHSEFDRMNELVTQYLAS